MFSVWDPFRELEAFERDVNRLFTGTRSTGYPPVNIGIGDDDVVVTSEIPGIESESLDLSVTGDTLTFKGERKPLELKNGESMHRRERGYGEFSRTIRLPYVVDGERVEAKYEKGVLRITLPRAESDKPRKVTVRSVEP